MTEQNTVFPVAEQQQTDLGSNWIIFQMRTASSAFLSDPGISLRTAAVLLERVEFQTVTYNLLFALHDLRQFQKTSFFLAFCNRPSVWVAERQKGPNLHYWSRNKANVNKITHLQHLLPEEEVISLWNQIVGWNLQTIVHWWVLMVKAKRMYFSVFQVDHNDGQFFSPMEWFMFFSGHHWLQWF